MFGQISTLLITQPSKYWKIQCHKFRVDGTTLKSFLLRHTQWLSCLLYILCRQKMFNCTNSVQLWFPMVPFLKTWILNDVQSPKSFWWKYHYIFLKLLKIKNISNGSYFYLRDCPWISCYENHEIYGQLCRFQQFKSKFIERLKYR